MKRLLMLVSVIVIVLFSKGREGAIDKYLNKVAIGEPIEYKNLKIFPLMVTTPLCLRDFITLDEAMDRGWLRIKESGGGEVNFVEIKNNGMEMVYIMTGEMITGAKQDRMLQKDVLLPANSGWVKVPVYCVEHGRWVSVSPEFKSGGLVVPNIVRQRAKIEASQSGIWEEITKSQEQLGVASGTGTVRDNYEDKRVKDAVEDYVTKFEKIPQLNKSTIGVVVTVGNKIICFDMFANNGLLQKLWKKLVKSYAMDAMSGEKSLIDEDDVEEFLDALEDAKFVSVGTPGLGDLLAIESNFGKGSALVFNDVVVHMDFFLKEGAVIDDSGPRLDFRRQQRLDE